MPADTHLPVLPENALWWSMAAVALLSLMALARRKSSQKDPQRAFSADQRRVGFARAEQQCEMSTWWGARCTRTANHADHFYPHTRGGASSMRNLVAACAPCNLSKSSKMPTRIQRLLIAHRRRSYFPARLDRAPGEWFRG
ncbi:HNH endonuclease [Leucobacter sp. HY1910]